MRYKSIFQNEYTQSSCYLCGKTATQWHHIFNAYNKKHSEEYGLMIHLCTECHMRVHESMMSKMKRYAQAKCMDFYSMNENEFREVFGKSYL